MRPKALDENWINYSTALKVLAIRKKKGSASDIRLAEKRVEWFKSKLK